MCCEISVGSRTIHFGDLSTEPSSLLYASSLKCFQLLLISFYSIHQNSTSISIQCFCLAATSLYKCNKKNNWILLNSNEKRSWHIFFSFRSLLYVFFLLLFRFVVVVCYFIAHFVVLRQPDWRWKEKKSKLKRKISVFYMVVTPEYLNPLSMFQCIFFVPIVRTT